MKKLLALLLALLMAFGMVACGGEPQVEGPGEQAAAEEPEEAKLDAQAMAESFFDGLFKPDVQAMFDLMPFDPMLDKLEGDAKTLMEEAVDASIDEYQALLEEAFADSNISWTVEVLSEEAVGEEELASLNESYAEMELTVDEATAAATAISVTVDGVTVSADVRLVFVKISDNWYLDMDSMSVIEEMGVLPEEEEDTFDADYMVGSFLTYMLTPDFASLIGMMPPALQESLMAEMGEDSDMIVTYINSSLSEFYSLFDGVEVTHSYEIVAETEMDEAQVAELAAAYLPIEVEFSRAVTVDFTYTVSTVDAELPLEMTLIFVEQDGQWYVDGNCLLNMMEF